MDNTTQQPKQGSKWKIFFFVTLAIILLLGAATAYYIWTQKQTIDVLTEQFEIEKEDLQNEYTQLAIQYEGYKLTVNNDSLEQKLEDQRIKMQRLVEELKQTKAQDARRINELKKELETVRGVLRYYVAQVDSLNRINEALVAENKNVRQQIRTERQHNENLKKVNEQLTQKVTLASQLTVASLKATALNKREKNTKSLKRTTTFKVEFTIAANVTAEIGEKDIYVRILKPNEELLVNNRSGQFEYDGSMIQYSMKRTIEYGGQETPATLFWNRNETLEPGIFTFEVYADGNLIGKTSLTMKK